jgi:hypothetical protein
MPGSVVAFALADADTVGRGEEIFELGVGEEDQGLDEREALGAAGGLVFEEGFELLVLAVGGKERVIDNLLTAVGLEIGPGAAVAAELACVALDFDEEEPAGRGDEGVDLIDGAVTGDAGEVRPTCVRVAVGERGTKVFEGFGFPRKGRFSDTLPTLWREGHESARTS